MNLLSSQSGSNHFGDTLNIIFLFFIGSEGREQRILSYHRKNSIQHGSHYFSSKVFLRLFLSFSAVILIFVVAYSTWYITAYQRRFAETMNRSARQETDAWATYMDRQLFTAQSLCASVNSSENLRSIFQTSYLENKTIDSMQLYRLLREFKRIRASASNMNITNLFLCFQKDHKIFMPGGVTDIIGTPQMLQQEPELRLTSVAQLLGVSCVSQMAVNKQNLIYAESYTGFSVNMPAGVVMVMLENTALQRATLEQLQLAQGAQITFNDQVVTDYGTLAGNGYTVTSLISDDIRYTLYVDPAVFQAPFFEGMLPVAIILGIGLLFILITYFISRKFYQPIQSIGKMIDTQAASGDEIENMLAGIRNLIGERNGYREKMLTITPYARQGIMHSLLHGGTQNQSPSLLTDSEFFELKRSFFMLGIVNIAGIGHKQVSLQRYQDTQELVRHVCHEMSSEEYSVVCCPKNVQNTFVIIGTDEQEGVDGLFTSMHALIREALDDPDYAVTIGVSGMKSDLESLQSACQQAQKALERMLIGGRDRVYFARISESETTQSYYFPKDALRVMTKGLKEGNTGEIHAMLEDVYRRNVREGTPSLHELHMLMDELHLSVGAALQSVFDRSTTHIQLEYFREPMTIEEIFSYYKNVFDIAVQQLSADTDADNPDELEERVCNYIDSRYCDPDLSLNALADRFGVSTKVIGTICKKRYGKTFLQYVREKQIGRAAELLKTTEKTLEEISQQCGFINVLTFRRNFKAVMGVNPSDFRH